MKIVFFLTLLLSLIPRSLFAQNLFESRVASIFVSEQFINEQLSHHLTKSDLVRNLKLKLDPASSKMYLHGDFHLPLDDMRTIGIERDLAKFKFQLSILVQIRT